MNLGVVRRSFYLRFISSIAKSFNLLCYSHNCKSAEKIRKSLLHVGEAKREVDEEKSIYIAHTTKINLHSLQKRRAYCIIWKKQKKRLYFQCFLCNSGSHAHIVRSTDEKKRLFLEKKPFFGLLWFLKIVKRVVHATDFRYFTFSLIQDLVTIKCIFFLKSVLRLLLFLVPS